MRPVGLVGLFALVLLVACGGGNGAPPAAPVRATAATGKAAAKGAAKGPSLAPGDTSLVSGDSTQLQREMFSYKGAGRDPFLSLLKSSSLRPLVTDVRVAGIAFDAAYPARSVAVLRDTAQRKRFAVRVGDELGKMRVSEIRRDAVVVTIDDFGVERQVVLPVGRKQEETP